MDVRDVMTTSVVSVGRATPLKDVAQLLVENRISGVPVVDADGTLLGVVTEADFVAKERGDAAVRSRRFAWLFGDSAESRDQLAKVRASSAGEAMTAPAITIEPGRSISEAARLMTERRVNRLPVVEDGKLVGIVARADLVRPYVRSDAELAELVRKEVLLETLWVDPARFDVDVRDGRVAISGRVDRRSTADMIERSIRRFPGVVDVDAAIEWAKEDSEIEPPSTDPVFPYSPR